jgi:NAD(P)-dependent dehydrogenase (short-subunit alcohol dehydrogenase family)
MMQRHVVITGATSGIGLASCRELVAAGYRVTAVGRDKEKLREVEREVGVATRVADLADPISRARLAEWLSSDGQVDVLVNNAAECVYESPLNLDAARLSRLFEINVVAPVELARHAARQMRPGGHIVQLSSVTAKHLANAKFAPYGTTKAALEQLTEALRLELHPRGIAVSTLVPGLVDTPIYDKLPNFEATRAKLHEQVERWLQPEDVARVLLWVLSQPAHVVVGEVSILPRGQAR